MYISMYMYLSVPELWVPRSTMRTIDKWEHNTEQLGATFADILNN